MDGEIRAPIDLAIYRHQTQKTIREQQQQLQAILHSTGEGFITFDNHNKIGYMNMVAEMMTGWRQDEAFGKQLAAMFKADIVHLPKQELNTQGMRKSFVRSMVLGLAPDLARNTKRSISRAWRKLESRKDLDFYDKAA